MPSPGKRTLVDRLGRRSGGASLDAPLRGRLEEAAGADLSDVRLHTGDDAAESAAALDARAFAVGQDVYFGAGEYRPDEPGGQMLIAHEIAHTVQQRGAEAAPARQALEVSEPADPHEQEADAFAHAFVSGGALAVRPVAAGAVSRAKVQRETAAAPPVGTKAPAEAAVETAGEGKLAMPMFEVKKDVGLATVTYKIEAEVAAKELISKSNADPNAAKPGKAAATVSLNDTAIAGKPSQPDPGDDKKTEISGGLGSSDGTKTLGAEVKKSLGTLFKSKGGNIEVKGFAKGGFETKFDKGKIAVATGLECKMYGRTFTVSPEFTIVSWEPGKKPQLAAVAASFEIPTVKVELSLNGNSYTVEGKVKGGVEIEPDWAQVGARIAAQIAKRLGPRVLAALPGAIAVGAGVLGTAALAKFTQFMSSGEWLKYGHSALDVARDYSAAYVEAVKGKPATNKNESAAKGYAEGLVYLKTQQLPAGAIAAAAEEDAHVYERAWKAMWPKYSEVAVKYYEDQHPVLNFFRNDGQHLRTYFFAFYNSPWGGPETDSNL